MAEQKAEGRGSAAADGRGQGSFVVLLNGGADRRVQYFTAKAICAFWSAPSLQAILDRLHAGENIVLFRAASRAEADALVERFAALGATAWVVEQRDISGVHVF
ncbi:MAG: hypothetical protein ACRDHY_12495 [Anaerolineales bacterium]